MKFSSVFCVAPTVIESTRRRLPRLEYEPKSAQAGTPLSGNPLKLAPLSGKYGDYFP